ncbi:unnamed protein product, partial [Chrysoparadoxa australica]
VGKKADNPATIIARYPQLIVNRRQLANGNVEIELRWVKNCRVFYEVEKGTKVIKRWHFEGSKENCSIVP